MPGALFGVAVLADDPVAQWEPAGAVETAESDLLRARMSPERHASYRRGRRAAHDALALWLRARPGEGVSVVRGPLGQPLASVDGGEAPEVSIAHSGSWAVAAVLERGRPVGVDVESRAGWTDGTAARAVSSVEREVAARAGLATVDAALAVWTAREAGGKALGTGLLVGADVLDVDDVRRVGEHTFECRFAQLPAIRAVTQVLDGVVVSVATYCLRAAQWHLAESRSGTGRVSRTWGLELVVPGLPPGDQTTAVPRTVKLT